MKSEIIKQIKQKAKAEFVPIVRDKTLIAMLEEIRKHNPKRILEIGTAVGYSALNMLTATNSEIVTIEKNEDRVFEAQENFVKAGVEHQINLIKGDAIEVLENLVKRHETFDFVFLDGPKGQYIKYLPLILDLLSDNGMIFADNVGLLGLVADGDKVTHKNRTMVRNMQAFLEKVTTDEGLQTQIFDVDDGYAVIHKVQKNDRKG